jgi:hypothetical protein
MMWMNAMTEGSTREAFALFQDTDKVNAAVSDLEGAGFDRSEMSLLAQQGVLDGHMPGEYGEIHKAAEDPKAPREAVIADTDVRQGRTLAASTVAAVGAFAASGITIMTGGTAAVAIAAAAAAGLGSAAVGEALGKKASDSEKEYLREQLRRGGIVLWVKTPTPEKESRARQILTRHCASEVRVHDVPI